jgi:hypothetical protein
MPQQTARARIALGRFAMEAEVAVSPAGLIAIGALVSGILLSVVPIIRASKAPPRLKEPPAAPRLNA